MYFANNTIIYNSIKRLSYRSHYFYVVPAYKMVALRAGAPQGQVTVYAPRRGHTIYSLVRGTLAGAGFVPRTTPRIFPLQRFWHVAVPTGVPTALQLSLCPHTVRMPCKSIAVPTGGYAAHMPCALNVQQQLLPAARIIPQAQILYVYLALWAPLWGGCYANLLLNFRYMSDWLLLARQHCPNYWAEV